MEKEKKSLQALELLLGITFMSTSGVFAKVILLPAPVTIWLRCVLALVPFFLVLKFFRTNLWLTKKQIPPVLTGGVLMAGHWVSYFYALHFSTVALGMLSLFTYPIFLIILEPIFLKKKLQVRHIPLALLAFAGVYFLVPEFSLSNDHTIGILFGIGSAVVYSVRNIIVKKHAHVIPGEAMMFHQVVVMTVFLIPVAFIFNINPVESISDNWAGLLALALVTTVIGHSFFVRSFSYFSASSIGLVSNLTPLIGILLAWVFISEVPTGNVLLGGGLILGTIFLEAAFSRNRNFSSK